MDVFTVVVAVVAVAFIIMVIAAMMVDRDIWEKPHLTKPVAVEGEPVVPLGADKPNREEQGR